MQIVDQRFELALALFGVVFAGVLVHLSGEQEPADQADSGSRRQPYQWATAGGADDEASEGT
ncbi:MAG: hypothetical protein ACRD3W_11170, partial [Terriglobales bacterium]